MQFRLTSKLFFFFFKDEPFESHREELIDFRAGRIKFGTACRKNAMKKMKNFQTSHYASALPDNAFCYLSWLLNMFFMLILQFRYYSYAINVQGKSPISSGHQLTGILIKTPVSESVLIKCYFLRLAKVVTCATI